MFLLKKSLNFFLVRKDSIILKIMAVASSCGGFFIHRLFYVLANPLNRITAATDNTRRFGLSNVKYDKNENFTHLTRGGHLKEMPDWDKDDDFGTMDQLDYQYFDGSNRLRSVTDGISKNDTSGKGEFVDGNKDGDDYVYDPNGNMTQDLNKGIKGTTSTEKGIEYNHLNLPTLVRVNNGADVGTISYIYDATGVKLRKNVLKQGETTPTATDYAGNYIYENGNLKQFSTAEGYVEPKGNDWQYVYRYKDVWGNTRITYADDNNDGNIDASSEIRREQNYYPFGLQHKGYNTVLNGVKNNLKTYQGQEFTEDLGLNVHEWKYRFADPAIGRFWQIDPLANMYAYNSTYAFAENKLGLGIELEGLEIIPTYGMEYANAKTSEDFKRIQQAKLAESAGIIAGIAIWVIPAAIAAAGPETTGAFLANEAKDEALSQATNGASDIFDLTKMAFKGLKKFGEFSAKKIFGKGAKEGGEQIVKSTSFSLDNVALKNVPTLQGKGDIGWLDGETLSLNINSIQKNFDSSKGSAFNSLTEYAENLAKENGLTNVRIEFGPVMNQRLANDPSWAKEYGYYFSSTTDDLGNTVVTWEKVLD